MICPECGGTLVKTSEPVKEKLRGHEFVIIGIEHEKCDQCGEVMFSGAALKERDAALWGQCREKEGLLTPEEIRATRESLGFTQKEFEAVLGVTSPTVSRWETGKAIQSKMADNFIRVLGLNHNAANQLAIRAGVKQEPICAMYESTWKAGLENAGKEVHYA